MEVTEPYIHSMSTSNSSYSLLVSNLVSIYFRQIDEKVLSDIDCLRAKCHDSIPLMRFALVTTYPFCFLSYSIIQGVFLLQLGVPKSPGTVARSGQDEERHGGDCSRSGACFLQQAISGGESNVSSLNTYVALLKLRMETIMPVLASI